MWSGSDGQLPPNIVVEESGATDEEMETVGDQNGVLPEGFDIAGDDKMEEELNESQPDPVGIEISGDVEEMKEAEPTPLVPALTLPKEVWMIIFDMVDDEDLESCYNTTPEWQGWLEEDRALLQLEKVFPFIKKRLTKSDVLNCRLVSHGWKLILDPAYQSQPSQVRLGEEFVGRNIPELAINFNSAAKIQQFLQEMASHPVNPFPGRSIYLNFESGGYGHDEYNVEEAREYGKNVLLLLDRFGRYVQFLELNLDSDIEDGIELLGLLRNILIRLPNLKRLTMHREVDVDASHEEMQRFVMENPMPRLRDLETLEIRDLDSPTLKDFLFESCCVSAKVKRLNFGGKYENTVLQFPNLEVLIVDLSIEDLEGFKNVCNLPPLKEVSLSLVDVNHCNILDFQRVFKSLEVLSNSLERVDLNCRWKPFTSTDFRIHLPKLERLTISAYEGPVDPLLSLNSLRYLFIRHRYEHVSTGPSSSETTFIIEDPWGGDVVFRYDESCRNKENLWRLIPSLRKFRLSSESDIFRRHIFEHTMKLMDLGLAKLSRSSN